MVRRRSSFGGGKFRDRGNGSDELLPAVLGAAHAFVERSLGRGQFRLREPDRESRRICRALHGGFLDRSNGHLRGGRLVAGFNPGIVRLGVPRQTLKNLVNGKSGISPEMAIRLSKAFGSAEETWLRMQLAFDLAEARKTRVKSRCDVSTWKKCTRTDTPQIIYLPLAV